MPSQFNNIDFSFSVSVPEGCLPLAYINTPVPEIGRDLKIIGGLGYTPENTDGAILKSELGGGITVSSSVPNPTYGVSGILVADKIPDSTFQFGVYPAASGGWWIDQNDTGGALGWNLVNGRTSLNSSYQTGDDPGLGQPSYAQPYCAAGLWASGTPMFTMQSPHITAQASGGELSLPLSSIAYQFSMWVATDPVNNAGYRVGPNGQMQDISDTMITVNIYAYASNTPLGTVWEGNIGWAWPQTQKYLNQPTTTYLKFESPLFSLPAGATSIVIQMQCMYAQGVYFDDIRLASFSYAPINTSIVSVAGSGILANPGLVDSSHISGDFSQSYLNMCPDPSFELEEWTIYGTQVYFENINWLNQSHWHGTSRTGNNFLGLLPNTGHGAYIQITGLNASGSYNIGGWHYTDTSQGGSLADSCVLKLEAWSAPNGSLLGTFTSAPISGAVTYSPASMTVNLVTYPTATMWRLKVEGADTSSNLSYMNWDDMYVQPLGSIISPWTFNEFQSVSPTGAAGYFLTLTTPQISLPLSYYSSNPGAVLAYGEAGAKFTFNQVNTGETVQSHIVQPVETIYKNQEFFLSGDFCNRYFNTKHIMTSEPEPVSRNSPYGVNLTLCWPGAIQGVTLDMDNTVRGAFAEPFTAQFPVPGHSGTGRTYQVVDYGRILVTVNGLNSGGAVTETPLNYEISPRDGNLPLSYVRNAGDTNYQAPMLLPQFEFTNPQTVSGRISISFIATIAGVTNVNMAPYFTSTVGTTTTSGTVISNNPYSTVYGVSSSITVDGAMQDSAGGWRLLVKDGVFERPYVMSSLEPTGSWLRQAGFKDGDNLVLVYTLPEYNLGNQWIDPSNPNVLNHYQLETRILCQSLTDNIISLGRSNIAYLTELIINGVSVISQPPSGSAAMYNLATAYPGIVSSADPVNGTITLSRSVNSTDIIEASFVYQSPRHIYRGYYDGVSWHDLDLNPSAGHMTDVGVDYKGKPGASLLDNPILLYLIPTCAYYASGDLTGNYVYRTAFDVAASGFVPPYSFLRHMSGGNILQGTVPGYPSAAIISKIFITPPGTIDDIWLMDVRSRGGGLPDSISTSNPPPTFTEESRCAIPFSSTGTWTNTRVMLYPNDYVTVTFNGLPVSGSAFQYSNPIGAIISSTVPSSGASAAFNPTPVWNIVAAPTVNVTGSTYAVAPSGMLFLSTQGLYGYGYVYATIRVTRKFVNGSIWDENSWDGDPVMMNGVVIVNIPKDVLTGANGYSQLSTSQVEEIVNKHVAAGVLPIIRYV